MQSKISRKIFAMVFTIFLLTIINLLSSVLLPWFGISTFKPLFHVVLILFFSFYLKKDDWLPIYILIIELVNSLFTIQGWEIGTLSGIILSVLIYLFKDLIHLSSVISSILYSFVFLVLWYFIFSLIYYSKIHHFDFFWNNLPMHLFESLFAAIVSPFLFTFFIFLWGEKSSDAFAT